MIVFTSELLLTKQAVSQYFQCRCPLSVSLHKCTITLLHQLKVRHTGASNAVVAPSRTMMALFTLLENETILQQRQLDLTIVQDGCVIYLEPEIKY